MSLSLGQEASRWQPRSESDLIAAIEARVLEETHHLEVKRELGSNKELARDLASFAIDGGALLVGVDEDKEARRWIPAPMPLAGLSERVELVARHSIDPPLNVMPRVIPADGPDVSRGYLLIEISPSASAPHLVGGIYYGRGSTTRDRLSDAQVVVLHAQRENVEARANALLEEEIERDPVDRHLRIFGHLYLIAQPRAARPDVAVRLVRSSDAGRRLVQLVAIDAEQDIPSKVAELGPTPRYATKTYSVADGLALTTPEAGPGRSFFVATGTAAALAEKGLLDIEFREDGGIRVTVGHATTGYQASSTDPPKHIREAAVLGYCFRLLRWAREVGDATGYHGGWLLGVAATSLRGGRGLLWASDIEVEQRPVYDRDDYRQVTTATYAEIGSAPADVVDRLAGRLLRALGTRVYYDDVLGDFAVGGSHSLRTP